MCIRDSYECVSDQAGAGLPAKSKGVCGKTPKPLAAKIEVGEYFPRDFFRVLGRRGFLGAPFSTSDGDLGLGWVCETILAEEVSAVSAAAEMARLASAALYSAPLAYFGSRVQKRELRIPENLLSLGLAPL